MLVSFDFDHCLKEDCEKEKEGWDAHDCRYEEWRSAMNASENILVKSSKTSVVKATP